MTNRNVILAKIEALIPDMEITAPYRGRWLVSLKEKNIGVINGDNVIGFTARDVAGRSVGRYDNVDVALDALLAAQP